ncbi:MAG: uroporphyrinogen-III C-methyltransferase [Acidobacteria bacterium]|nr:uroporphyrinogen-III C-methyltransferase [Acidobacteriota bacterium]
MKSKRGKVYLVGAGPGDPGLLTLKGKAALEQADVVIYDYLANPALLRYAPPRARLIYAGKRAGKHKLSQEEINRLLVRYARAGKTVVRLKGGDPFVFGRGGEEAEALMRARVGWEVVPGVTAGTAAPAYAGIPITDRRHASSVALITGHEDPDKSASALDWSRLARGADTLVFFMGVRKLPAIARQLIAHGRSPETPAAVIRWGTQPQQKVVEGTLATIAHRAAGIEPPAVTVVGDVVRLRRRLRWFESKPLFGRRILITRTREQASQLRAALEELGAEVIELPTIALAPPRSWQPLDAAIRRLGQYDWVVFTSANGVETFFARLRRARRDARALGGAKIAAIGPATAAVLRQHGLEADVVPEEFRAEGLVKALKDESWRTKRVLVARAAEAREVLPRELRRRGAQVDVVAAYRTVLPRESRRQAQSLFANRPPDMIAFTSSSTARNFSALLPPRRARRALRGVAIAAIGPVTARTVRELGWRINVTSNPYTIPALMQAIVRYFASRERPSSGT